MTQLTKTFSNVYDTIQETRTPFRRFPFNTVLEILSELRNHPNFKVDEIGRSVEDRPIHSVTIGKGPLKMILWTQMHGNESTATRAVFDFFQWVKQYNNTKEAQSIFNSVTLRIIPVVNPDGMVRYVRRNAMGIDPNRDAVRQTTPEIQTLFKAVKEFNPDWCFNMHDQRNLFNVKGSAEPASLSFLSPSTADGKRGQNQNDAMMMIDKIHQCLSEYIPKKMGRFTHEYYPTASGDNLQSMGYRTILVESGGHRNDEERNIPRKMNFLLILEALRLIASEEWKKGTVMRYAEIPENDQKLFDVLIRNARLRTAQGYSSTIDIGIDLVEVPATNQGGFVIKSSVRDLGDLSYYYGYTEFEAQGGVLEKELELNQVASFTINQTDGSIVKVNNGILIHG